MAKTIYEVLDEIQDATYDLIKDMHQTSADKLGLDIRAGYKLWVNQDCIVVRKGGDGMLQYYGGFEYVEKTCRVELGDYVAYLNEDSRVEECIQNYFDAVDNPEEKTVDL